MGTHDEDVKQCLDAIQAVLEVCGVDMNCPHDELTKQLNEQLDDLRQSLQESPSHTREIRKNITKIAMSPCGCEHPLWAHNQTDGCQQIVFSDSDMKLQTCGCAEYRAIGSVKTDRQKYIEANIRVPCPKCNAIAGEACKMKDGEHYPNASYFHAARKRAATQPAETL